MAHSVISGLQILGLWEDMVLGGIEGVGERMGSCSSLQGHALNDSKICSPPYF